MCPLFEQNLMSTDSQDLSSVLPVRMVCGLGERLPEYLSPVRRQPVWYPQLRAFWGKIHTQPRKGSSLSQASIRYLQLIKTLGWDHEVGKLLEPGMVAVLKYLWKLTILQPASKNDKALGTKINNNPTMKLATARFLFLCVSRRKALMITTINPISVSREEMPSMFYLHLFW